jgi:tRNA pseudouridine38-40 synthase
MRVAMGIEYDGTGFHGWQVQGGGARTVQGCLQVALSRVADEAVTVHCAGRTDAGVHARAQVIHFEAAAHRSPRSWVLGTNVNLPRDVSATWALEVDGDFHARFSATARHYRYDILNRMTRSALHRDRAVWTHRPLDVRRMQAAAVDLVGTHDYSSFRALACQAKSPVRTVFYLEVTRCDDLVSIAIGANGFLHHMVRNISGVLMSIGRGDRPVGWARVILGLRDRARGGGTAPPEGLYLVRVDYPPRFGLGGQRGVGRCAAAPEGGAPPAAGDELARGALWHP